MHGSGPAYNFIGMRYPELSASFLSCGKNSFLHVIQLGSVDGSDVDCEDDLPRENISRIWVEIDLPYTANRIRLGFGGYDFDCLCDPSEGEPCVDAQVHWRGPCMRFSADQRELNPPEALAMSHNPDVNLARLEHRTLLDV